MIRKRGDGIWSITGMILLKYIIFRKNKLFQYCSVWNKVYGAVSNDNIFNTKWKTQNSNHEPQTMEHELQNIHNCVISKKQQYYFNCPIENAIWGITSFRIIMYVNADLFRTDNALTRIVGDCFAGVKWLVGASSGKVWFGGI